MIRNTFKTFTLLAAIAGLLIGIGQVLGGRSGASVGLIIGLAMVGFSYWFSDKLAIRSARAREVTEAEAPQLYGMVRELTQKADMPMPRVYVSDNSQPNAFATGRNPHHSAVCVTDGLLQVLSPREVKGVLAHELGHVKHRDILIGSIAAAVATAITFAARMALWFGMGGSDDDDRPNPIVMLLLMLLAPFAAMIIQMALSRTREFEADRFGAEASGDPEALASALERIEAYVRRVPMDISPQQATAYIVNPLTGRKVNFANLFSTHPATAERVRRLRTMAGAA